MIKKKPLKSSKWLKANCDKVVSLIVRINEPACVTCGSTESLGNGHVFSRRHSATRWDITPDGNCHTSCWPCNFKHVRDQQPYFAWYIDKFGYDKFNELRARYNQTKQIKTSDLRELNELLNEELKRLTNKI